jgi:hypothetical protein
MPQTTRVGGKIVAIDAGRLVLDANGDIAFEAGHHDQFVDGVDVCGLLDA